MLRYCLLAFVVVSWTAPLRASWAEGLFEEHSKNFGSVPRGPMLTHPFRVINKTGTTVHISSVRVSCGCTSAHALETTLARDKTAIVAQMDTRRFFDNKVVHIYVQFDQPTFEEVRLWVQANSRGDLAILPESLEFGTIRKGASAESSVTVSFFGSGQEIVAAHCDSNYVKLDFREVRRDGGEVAYQVSARIRPDAPAGKWYTDVWLSAADSSMPRIRIPLTVQIETPTPTPVGLGTIKVGTPTDKKIVLRSAKPFKITAIRGTDAEVDVHDSNPESRNIHVLIVTLQPHQAGLLERTIRVETDLNNNRTIEFKAKVQAVP